MILVAQASACVFLTWHSAAQHSEKTKQAEACPTKGATLAYAVQANRNAKQRYQNSNEKVPPK
jgi:hypothetical protein